MGKVIVILFMIIGLILIFFRGAIRLVNALTGYKRTTSNNNNNVKNRKKNDDEVLYEYGETKIFKGTANNKKKEGENEQ